MATFNLELSRSPLGARDANLYIKSAHWAIQVGLGAVFHEKKAFWPFGWESFCHRSQFWLGKVGSQGFHQIANTQSWVRHTSGLPSWHHHHGFSTKEINFWKQIGFAMKNISPVITWATTWSDMTHSWGMFLQRTFYTNDVSTYSNKKQNNFHLEPGKNHRDRCKKSNNCSSKTMFVFHTCDLVEKDACDLGLKNQTPSKLLPGKWKMELIFSKN